MGDIIERFSAKNYGCLKDVDVALTPLHAFIGPNDSGKSTLLRGIRTIVQFAAENFTRDDTDQMRPFDPGIDDWPEGRLEVTHRDIRYTICAPGTLVSGNHPENDLIQSGDVDEQVVLNDVQVSVKRRRVRRSVPSRMDDWGNLQIIRNDPNLERAGSFFRQSGRMLRFDPNALRTPSKLIKSDAAVEFEDDAGRGLPGIYDVILNQHMDGFVEIRNNLRKLFPSVRSLGLENMSESTKEIRIQITSGEWIPARFMSEGMLYYLAFEAIRFLRPSAVLLIEEPENGLHPARIVEVMKVLREISKTTQVILATHSPLVINELKPEEVSVVTRSPETGTKVTPMKETANFEKRSTAYSLGELWLSFADGIEEAPLLQGRSAQ